ncbi:hypothetical protein AVEN_159084-1 [Araneus ventricosus]|uniref:Uncharacterized protein n=1 Tax=Araneus ventricosus TaxID=182803 RepID=A0A4Y2B9P8_ARAVE|nr:hypothetical protein AVEN_159084-1 [Araneus ventricosus]
MAQYNSDRGNIGSESKKKVLEFRAPRVHVSGLNKIVGENIVIASVIVNLINAFALKLLVIKLKSHFEATRKSFEKGLLDIELSSDEKDNSWKGTPNSETIHHTNGMGFNIRKIQIQVHGDRFVVHKAHLNAEHFAHTCIKSNSPSIEFESIQSRHVCPNRVE